MRFAGRTALITGAGGGIGGAVARAFAVEGADLGLADIKPVAALADALRGQGRRVIDVPTDVTQAVQVQALVRDSVKALGRIDILVNVAGTVSFGSAESLAEAEWERVLAVNLKGTFLCCQAVIGCMRAQKYGRIINIGSILGKNGGNARPWIDRAEQAHAGRDWTKLPVYRGAIAVNRHAKRYVDESKSYKLLGDAVLQEPDGIAYQIFDQGIMDNAADGVPPFDFRSAQRRGLLFEAATLDDLAVKIGVDATQLAATVARYNEFVTKGVDADFGRDGLSTHYGKLVKIERALFFAYPSTSGIIATYCGLTVDADTRVLNVFGEPIAGLFAAGELMGGFHGVSYMTGSSLGKCVIFGRIAGRNAAHG